jgi:hypothetical protein
MSSTSSATFKIEKKYGKIVHIAVDPNSDGDIYIKFGSVSGEEKAMQGCRPLSFRLSKWRGIFALAIAEFPTATQLKDRILVGRGSLLSSPCLPYTKEASSSGAFDTRP